jgi:putative tricarboxylic transport membrane protein
MYGIQPGLNLFQAKGTLVWALMWGLIIASFAYVIIGGLFANFFVRLTVVPVEYLIPITLVTCYIGAFSIHNNFYDMITVFFFGIMGFIMRVLKYPVAPAVLGVVLGPVVEINFNRALLISNGSYQVFFSSVFSWIMWILLAAVVIAPYIRKYLKARQIA